MRVDLQCNARVLLDYDHYGSLCTKLVINKLWSVKCCSFAFFELAVCNILAISKAKISEADL